MSTDLPPPAAPAPAPAPVPAKKSNTLVIVLCVVFGVLLLILASCVGTCIYVGKKAKDYSEETKKSPQISALSLMAAVTPGIEVVTKDLDAGTITLKNTKTGELVSFNAKDLSEDKIASIIEGVARGKGVAQPSSNSTARVDEASATSSPEPVSAPTGNEAAALNSTVKSFASDFPVYSGSNVTTLDAGQESFAGVSTTRHTFRTSDAPDKVAAFYVKKLEAAGYSLLASDNGTDENGAKLMRVFQKGGMGSTLNVEVRVEDGKTHVEVNQVNMKQP